MIRVLLPTALSCSLIISGCAVLVAGTATGVGVYTYMNGVLTRSYQAPFDKIGDECTAVLEILEITVTEKTCGGIRTKIRGMRSDGTPVTVDVVMIAPRTDGNSPIQRFEPPWGALMPAAAIPRGAVWAIAAILRYGRPQTPASGRIGGRH